MVVQHRRYNNSLAMNCWYHEHNVIIDHRALSFLKNTILSSSSLKAEVFVIDHSCDNIRVVACRVNDKRSPVFFALRMVINRLDRELFADFSTTRDPISSPYSSSTYKTTID